MLRPLLLAGAALAAIPAPPLAAQPAPAAVTAPPIAFTEWKLANGLTVIALPDPTTANVMTSVWYDVGSKNDPQGRSGFAHLFEHILSRKTENMPYNMINRLTEDVGGQRNASTGDDRTAPGRSLPGQPATGAGRTRRVPSGRDGRRQAADAQARRITSLRPLSAFGTGDALRQLAWRPRVALVSAPSK